MKKSANIFQMIAIIQKVYQSPTVDFIGVTLNREKALFSRESISDGRSGYVFVRDSGPLIASERPGSGISEPDRNMKVHPLQWSRYIQPIDLCRKRVGVC
jgi:hypothetical protein